jgi:VanZ family protein
MTARTTQPGRGSKVAAVVVVFLAVVGVILPIAVIVLGLLWAAAFEILGMVTR